MNRFKKNPAYIRDTKQLNRLITQEETKYNLKLPATKNLGLPPFEGKLKLEHFEIDTPKQTRALRSPAIRENPDGRTIDLNRKKKLQDPNVQFDKTQVYNTYNKLIQQGDTRGITEISVDLKDLKDDMVTLNSTVNRIEKKVTRKPKKKHKSVPKRDALLDTVFQDILLTEKPNNSNQKNWSRLLLATTLLDFSGMRINEAALLTASDIEERFEISRLKIYKNKVDEYRTIPFIEEAIPIIKKVYEANKGYIFGSHKYLYPLRPDGSPKGEKFVNLVNKQLNIFGGKHNLVLRSHSFRINYVTAILPHVTVQDVQAMVGHKNIRSTMAYSRYYLLEKDKNKILEKAFVSLKNLDT